MRRPYQVGPVTFAVQQSACDGPWWVYEQWFEHDRDGNDQDAHEWHGPYPSKAAAEAKAAEWRA